MKKKISDLEIKYERLLVGAGIPYQKQVSPIPGRRFAWDFQVGNMLIEIQGGIWKGKSGHNTGRGITRDCEKANLATAHGFFTMFFTGKMIDSGEALKLTKAIIEPGAKS